MSGDPWAGPLLLQLVLIFLSACYAAAEVALLSLNATKLHHDAEEGDPTAAKLLRMTDAPARTLSTIQVCITLFGFLGSALAATQFAPRLAGAILSAGAGIDADVLNVLCVILITFLLSYLTLCLGTLVPKRLAMKNPEAIARRSLLLLEVSAVIFRPFVMLLNAATHGILRLCGIDPNAAEDEVTEDDIRMMVDIGGENGAIEEAEKEMIENIFEFNNHTAFDVMTHRTDVIAISADATDEEILRTIRESGLSRIPVYEKTIDDVIGILRVREYLLYRAVDDNRTLREMLQEYIKFQSEVVLRRTQFDLKKALDRQHVLQGLLIAEDNIDEVIRTIRESYDNAKERLMERFSLSEIQAQVVLDMQLKRLQGLEREKLEAEYEELEKRIEYYRELLANEEMLKGVLKDELVAIRDKYGDDRLTEIQDVEDEIDIEDLIEEEQCVFTLSHAGYCKRVPASTYRSQKRGGRGVTGMTTKEEDFVEGVFTASTHDYILFFTNLGKVHRRKGYQIPEAGRTAKGTNLVNILPFEPGEKVTAGITVHEFDEDYLVFVTKNGTVKRLELASLNTARKAGIRALTLSEGDELIAVMKTDGKQDIMLASADGMAICFNENDVRVMGRDAAGVRGMALDAGDSIVGAGIAAKGKQLLSVTEYGYGKRTDIEEYMRLGDDGVRRPQQRGGKGLKNYNITAKTGRIAGVAIVDDEDDVMLIENGGVLIRMAAADINVYKRDAQGVILMRVEAGNRVISVDRVDREPEETADEHEEA